MRKLKTTAKFKKDAKLAKRRGFNIEKLNVVIRLLMSDEVLPEKYQDHVLIGGTYHKHSECHIQPDWLLIYLKSADGLVLTAVRTGSHSDLLD